jgi:putative copper resistance protein D
MGLRELVLYLHLVAAMFWIGEMLFLAAVLGPYGRTLPPEERGALFREVGRRSRPYAWTAIGVLVATGIANALLMGLTPAAAVQPSFVASPVGITLGLKLVTVVALIVSATWHDVVLAERSARLQAQIRAHGPRPDLVGAAERTRRVASWLGRLTLLLALRVTFFGVQLVLGA